MAELHGDLARGGNVVIPWAPPSILLMEFSILASIP